MLRVNKNLPIYVLSASLIFFGISTANQADAQPSDTSRIRNLENEVRNLKSCLNRQLSSIGFFSPERDRYIFVNRC